MGSVFIVWHTHETESSADEKLIGVYASRSDAEAAIDRLSRKPGFEDSPEGFEVSEYVLGKDHWAEGYVSQAEASHRTEE
jgi:hypothetical protein